MNADTNIIRRIGLHVKADNGSQPFQLRRRMEHLCSTLLPERLEKVLSGYETNSVIELPAIQLNIEGENWNLLETEILYRCCDEVEKLLRKSLEEIQSQNERKNFTSDQKKSEQLATLHSAADIFFFFLHHGTLPWWADYSSVRDVEDDFISWLDGLPSSSRRDLLLKSFKEFPNLSMALSRLVNQFSQSFQEKIIRAISEQSSGALVTLQKIFSASINKEDQQHTSLQLIQSFFTIELLERLIHEDLNAISRFENFIHNENELRVFLRKLSSNISEEATSKGAIEQALKNQLKETQEEKISKKKLDEKHDYYFIQNAGIVILHPFIEIFFRQLQLLDKEGNFRVNQIHKAVHLLHYCCSSENDPPEFKMILSKVLCGMPIEFSLEKIAITDEDKAACNELVQAVIKHWTALKNTSAIALQNTFFQREGKLEFKDETWWLKVEQKIEDILLDRLPWSISRIKTRWMKNWLRVEWNA